jgi:hypothetical protein
MLVPWRRAVRRAACIAGRSTVSETFGFMPVVSRSARVEPSWGLAQTRTDRPRQVSCPIWDGSRHYPRPASPLFRSPSLRLIARNPPPRLPLVSARWAAPASVTSPAATATRPPNLVVLIADDLRSADGLFNPPPPKEVAPPSLDRLASERGIGRHDYVTGPVCAPTRPGRGTGRSLRRLGLSTAGQFHGERGAPTLGLAGDEQTGRRPNAQLAWLINHVV